MMKNLTEPQAFRGNDRLLYGIILGVLAFWLFAQTTLNINVGMAQDLSMEMDMMNIAVSITSLFRESSLSCSAVLRIGSGG
ncbi:hypothetical protein [Chryseobacterium sp. 6424]|uniref:hypothetical protein n=1 Tax=Chryseobacterium sp. 6424 TaxID=2039166 RepID=UPI001E4A9F77|nr:hypothetical protein [Chryseobacterium sp. 6424]